MNTDDCWLYAGYKNELGYGLIFSNRKYQLAHRVSYETLVAPIPEGLVIDHLCRVRHCINPAHLEPVTARVNTLRGEGVVVNKRKTHCPKGHPYDDRNTSYNSKGWRICRQCEAARLARYYRANTEKWKVYNAK
jgi:hypothetical protein